jgi:bacteriorhodopsin
VTKTADSKKLELEGPPDVDPTLNQLNSDIIFTAVSRIFVLILSAQLHMSSDSSFPFIRSKYLYAPLVSSVHAVCFFTLGMNLRMFNSVTPLYDVIWAQMDMCLVLHS